MLRKLFHRLRASLRRGKAEREMERELRFHLEMETAKNIRRGMSEEEARQAACGASAGSSRRRRRIGTSAGFGALKRPGRIRVTACGCCGRIPALRRSRY